MMYGNQIISDLIPFNYSLIPNDLISGEYTMLYSSSSEKKEGDGVDE